MLEYLNNLDLIAIFSVLFIIAMLIVLMRWHNDDSKFDLREILIDKDTGTVSIHRVGQFTALAVSTVLIIHEATKGRLSEWLFTGYMVAWAGTSLINQWLKKDTHISSSNVSKSETKEKEF